MDSKKDFFLGRHYNLKKGEITQEAFYYQPSDLTSHALITGMTGSGKTGLGIILIEEAALQGIPAILVDPKGDLTNLLLTFPDLAPQDFEPWIDANTAKRESKSIAEMAESTALLWKKGLADWGIGSKELSQLKAAADRVVYTPGSSAGMPISIMTSFEAPNIPWKENEEILREKISALVTALLTLIGLKDIDSLNSREHILLSNIIEYNWKKGSKLDLGQLILQTQDPPLDKLGAFSLNDFIPKKERINLAILLNNLLASPSFQSWIEGQPLDIQSMLYTEDGRPRQSIFYLSHLADTERMFFITLLYSAIESWMRKQAGSSELRALIYFDEIHGYLPPIANPPSKPLIIRLLKTARAFGIGLVLATQNPVDVDYKALSNAGTWMIGRLQTDQDKQRLLDGLESAAEGGIQRSEYDKLISSLGKRVFLCHNVYEKEPSIFQTRFAMSYLAGPLTITQIPQLNALVGVSAESIKSKSKGSIPLPTAQEKGAISATKPALHGINEFFLPAKEDDQNGIFSPSLLAQAEVRYLRAKPPMDYTQTITAVVENPDENRQDWGQYLLEGFDASSLLRTPQEGLKFMHMPEFMTIASWFSSQEKAFEQWIYETNTITISINNHLSLASNPEISSEEFHSICKEVSKKKGEEEFSKLEGKYGSKKTALEKKIASQKLKIEKYRKDLASRGLDTALNVGSKVLDALAGRRIRSSSSITKGRMTADARARLKEAESLLENYEEELRGLDEELEEEKKALMNKWMDLAEDISIIKIKPTKQDIRITHIGILWKTQ